MECVEEAIRAAAGILHGIECQISGHEQIRRRSYHCSGPIAMPMLTADLMLMALDLVGSGDRLDEPARDFLECCAETRMTEAPRQIRRPPDAPRYRRNAVIASTGRATATNSMSPRRWPSVSLITLNRSRSRNMTAKSPPAVLPPLRTPLTVDGGPANTPVRQPGQRVLRRESRDIGLSLTTFCDVGISLYEAAFRQRSAVNLDDRSVRPRYSIAPHFSARLGSLFHAIRREIQCLRFAHLQQADTGAN